MKTQIFPNVDALLAAHPDLWRWPDFRPQEIACRDGSIMIDTEAMDRLQVLRSSLGQPLRINSAFRSVAHNTAVGGAPQSRHMRAEAFDLDMTGHDPHRVQYLAQLVGFHGIGRYATGGRNFLHVDIRPQSEAVTWGEDWPFGEDDPAPVPVIDALPRSLPEAPAAKPARKRGRGGAWGALMKLGALGRA